MAVAQWKSLRSLDSIQSSAPFTNANLWLGQQGTSGISKFQLQSNTLEIMVELELADIDTNYLEIKISPDLLTLSGIRYETDPDSRSGHQVSRLDDLFQPRSFRDLIPLPETIDADAAIATLNGQCLRITLPKATANELETAISARVYHYPKPLSVGPSKTLERGEMSDLLVPRHW